MNSLYFKSSHFSADSFYSQKCHRSQAKSRKRQMDMKHSANTCLCRSVARRTENASTDQVVILVTAVAAYSITTVVTAFQLTEVNRIGNNAIVPEDAPVAHFAVLVVPTVRRGSAMLLQRHSHIALIVIVNALTSRASVSLATPLRRVRIMLIYLLYIYIYPYIVFLFASGKAGYLRLRQSNNKRFNASLAQCFSFAEEWKS